MIRSRKLELVLFDTQEWFLYLSNDQDLGCWESTTTAERAQKKQFKNRTAHSYFRRMLTPSFGGGLGVTWRYGIDLNGPVWFEGMILTSIGQRKLKVWHSSWGWNNLTIQHLSKGFTRKVLGSNSVLMTIVFKRTWRHDTSAWSPGSVSEM